MVTQNTLRTHEDKQVFTNKIFRFVYSNAINRSNKDCTLCARLFLRSNTSTMILFRDVTDIRFFFSYPIGFHIRFLARYLANRKFVLLEYLKPGIRYSAEYLNSYMVSGRIFDYISGNLPDFLLYNR